MLVGTITIIRKKYCSKNYRICCKTERGHNNSKSLHILNIPRTIIPQDITDQHRMTSFAMTSTISPYHLPQSKCHLYSVIHRLNLYQLRHTYWVHSILQSQPLSIPHQPGKYWVLEPSLNSRQLLSARHHKRVSDWQSPANDLPVSKIAKLRMSIKRSNATKTYLV